MAEDIWLVNALDNNNITVCDFVRIKQENIPTTERCLIMFEISINADIKVFCVYAT